MYYLIKFIAFCFLNLSFLHYLLNTTYVGIVLMVTIGLVSLLVLVQYLLPKVFVCTLNTYLSLIKSTIFLASIWLNPCVNVKLESNYSYYNVHI